MTSYPPEPPQEPATDAGRYGGQSGSRPDWRFDGHPTSPGQPPPGYEQPGSGWYGQPGGYGGYPTAPPVSAEGWGQPVGSPTGAPLAGWWYRVGATVIDGLILSIITSIVRALAGLSASYAVAILIQIVYVTWLLGRPDGQTVGMMALGTRVISADNGGPIGYPTAFVRWLVSFLLGITLIGGLLDVLWPLWDRRNQTLHDKAVRSLVVRIR